MPLYADLFCCPKSLVYRAEHLPPTNGLPDLLMTASTV